MNKKLLILFIPVVFLAKSLSGQMPNLIFEATFENTLQSSENEDPAMSAGLTFESGASGMGVFMDEGDILQYPIGGNINTAEGTMTLWVRPTWNPGTFLYRIMVLGKETGNFEFHVDEGSNLAFAVNTGRLENKETKLTTSEVSNWEPGFWYFLAFTWNSETIKIFVNGQKVGESPVGYDIPGTMEDNFHLGSLMGEQPFKGTLDELRIYDGASSEEQIQSQYDEFPDSLPVAHAISVIDIFGQDVTTGITLVDWEGPVRNPAMKYSLKGNDQLTYPVSIELSAQEELASFNYPSTISREGPAKSMILATEGAIENFLMSIYMDENFENENFELNLQYTMNGLSVRQIIPVTVIDQDRDRPLSYPVIVDFSEVVHPLMQDAKTQAVITQAAEDWLYYVDGEGIDEIPVGGSTLNIGGQDHFFDNKNVSNPVPYTGYYLYAFGNSNAGPCVCSTGSPDREQLQSRNGEVVPIFRIGALHLNVFGQAYETEPTGWEVLSPFENWTLLNEDGSPIVPTDMYNLAKHEIGHAMVFENSPLFLQAQGRDPNNPFPDESLTSPPNGFTSPALDAYYPDSIVPLYVESLSHVIRVLDPASQVPPYGGGVSPDDSIAPIAEVMPGGREMLTKLDILIMESVGYPLRDNAVTKPLSLSIEGDLEGELETDYEISLSADGGIPVYFYEISEGILPNGLQLNARTGEILGVPNEEGSFPLTFRVRDYDERSPGASLDVTITIGEVVTATTEPVIKQLKIYPNPTRGLVTLTGDLRINEKMNFKVVNLAGKELVNKIVNPVSSTLHETMDLTGFPPGTYLIKIHQSDSSEVHKILVY